MNPDDASDEEIEVGLHRAMVYMHIAITYAHIHTCMHYADPLHTCICTYMYAL